MESATLPTEKGVQSVYSVSPIIWFRNLSPDMIWRKLRSLQRGMNKKKKKKLNLHRLGDEKFKACIGNKGSIDNAKKGLGKLRSAYREVE